MLDNGRRDIELGLRNAAESGAAAAAFFATTVSVTAPLPFSLTHALSFARPLLSTFLTTA